MSPERLYDHFIDTTGKLHIDDRAVTVELTYRTWTPVLLQAGYADTDLSNWRSRGGTDAVSDSGSPDRVLAASLSDHETCNSGHAL